MNMRSPSIVARAIAAVMLSIPALAASAAMIVPTGGTLTLQSYLPLETETVQIAAEYGSFAASSDVTLPVNGPGGPSQVTLTTTRVTGSYSIDSVSLIPTAYGYTRRVGAIQGSLGFDLTEETTVNFSFSEIGSPAVLPHHWLTIRDSQNRVVPGCVVSYAYGSGDGGCALGEESYASPDVMLPNYGTFRLMAGHYEVSFDLHGGVFQDQPYELISTSI